MPASPPLELASLIVTAQKRGQSIDEIPISITAWSGTSLETLGITRYEDLATLVPGLFVSVQSPSLPGINLRGITSDTADPRQEPRVSIFQDGVAISRAAGSFTELFDLERVEVLKGPQGTLFGRNAGAGAIALISRKPAAAAAASLTLGAGNHGRQHASGFLNLPLGGEHLLGRVAFTTERRDGTARNLIDGSDLNSCETVAVRPSLRWIPQTGTTVDLVVNFERNTPAGLGLKSGVIPTTRGDTDPYTAAELTRGAALGLERTVWGATLLVTHPLSAQWTLTAITAARAFDSHEELDVDGSRWALLEGSDDNRAHQLSQELRFNFDDRGRFTGFAGLAATRERANQRNQLRIDERSVWPFLSSQFRDGLLAAGLPAPLAFTAVPVMAPFVPQATLPAGFTAFAAVPPLAPLAVLAGAPLKSFHEEYTDNRAGFDAADVFADGTWRITERLEFTAGLRASAEKQTSGYEVPLSPVPSRIGFILGATPNFAAAPTSGRLTANAHDPAWGGRAIARYVFSPELNAYASLARGRRPAAIIINNAGTRRSDEEFIDNAEVGAKGSAWRGRVAWSAAAFHYCYRHFQTFVQDPTNIARSIPIDAGRATGSGGEFSARTALGANLSAFANYGYTDATFAAHSTGGATQQFAGSTFRLTARHTATAGFTVEHSAGRAGHFAFSPRWEYKSGHFFEDDNTLYGGTLHQGGYALAHARLEWRSADQHWAATIYADNVCDKKFLIDAGNLGGSFGIPTFIRGEPRLFGVNVTRRW